MKKSYIVFDLVAREVVFECKNEVAARYYIDEHNEQVLYLITLDIDTESHTVKGLNGCAY